MVEVDFQERGRGGGDESGRTGNSDLQPGPSGADDPSLYFHSNCPAGELPSTLTQHCPSLTGQAQARLGSNVEPRPATTEALPWAPLPPTISPS